MKETEEFLRDARKELSQRRKEVTDEAQKKALGKVQQRVDFALKAIDYANSANKRAQQAADKAMGTLWSLKK